MRDRLNCRTISSNSWCRRVSAGSQLEDFEPESEKVQLLSDNQLREVFEPVFEDIRKRATVAEKFLDRDLYRVYIATLWSNVVLWPDEVGIEEEDIKNEQGEVSLDEVSEQENKEIEVNTEDSDTSNQ